MLLGSAFLLGSCKKNNSSQNVLVGFHFHSWIGDSALDPSFYATEAYQDANHRLEYLTLAQLYLSNISVHMLNGAWQPLTGVVIMKRIDQEQYPLGTIPSGMMDSVKFTVGLGNNLNMMLPSTFAGLAIDSALYNNTALMWGSNMNGMTGMPSGYTFINVQGRDSSDHLPFSYQIGGYGDTANVTLAVPGGFNFNPVYTQPGAINFIHIVVDYGKLIQVINPMTTGNNISSFYGSNPAPANTILQNLMQNMNVIFHWECTPPINC